MDRDPDPTDPADMQEPPPFDPDPDLITFLERGKKPTREEVLGWIERSSDG
jgi:hypothetical protein